MKRKVNLTQDGELIARAKRYTRKKGIAVSALIESLLAGAVSQDENCSSGEKILKTFGRWLWQRHLK